MIRCLCGKSHSGRQKGLISGAAAATSARFNHFYCAIERRLESERLPIAVNGWQATIAVRGEDAERWNCGSVPYLDQV